MNKKKAMLIKGEIPPFLLTKATHTIVHLVNCTPTMSNSDRTPHKLLIGNKSNLNNIKIFRCLYFMERDITQRTKLESQSTNGIYLDPDDL